MARPRTTRERWRKRALTAALGVSVVAACATLRDTTMPMVRAECRARDDVTWSAASADSIVLNAWCAGVGPAAVLAAAPAGTPVADSVLVITWNTHVGGGNVDGLVRDIRSGALTGTPTQHFVLLLQEAYRAGNDVPAYSRTSRGSKRIAHAPTGSDRTDIVETAARLRLNLFYVPSMRNGGAGTVPEDRGNAILTSLPIAERTALELPFEVQRRVVAAATLPLTSSTGELWSVRVASVHLDTRSRLSRGFATFGGARVRQSRAIAEVTEGHDVAIVGGDLNTWSLGVLEAAPRALREELPDLPPVQEATFTVAGILPRRLDHMFGRLSGALARAPERIDDRYGSDHYPLMTVVRFTGAAPD